MFTVSEKLQFVRKVFGHGDLSRDEKNIAIICPYCKKKDGKKKLAIRSFDDYMHCWRCGYKSRSLIPTLKKMGRNDLVDYYAKKFKKDKALDTEDVVETLRLPFDFKLIASNTDDPTANRVARYLKSRGLSEADFWYYKFGVSDSPEFYERVIIPSFDEKGLLNYYTARSLTKRTFGKYMNAPVKKTEIIFNEVNIDWSSELTLTEGPFDLVKCNDNAACILGSLFTERNFLFQAIVEHSTPVVLALDEDKQKRQESIAELLASFNIPVRILSLGEYSDVGEMTTEAFEEALKTARPWDKFNSLRRRIRAL